MTESEKKKNLRRYKSIATGLFVLMAIIFAIMTVLQKSDDAIWIGYVRAFSEAAMVGALADWFAVTALFNYPLGLKIPHTNIIAKNKDKIGENLGDFVVDNFLSDKNIRPYISKFKVAEYFSDWLSLERNQDLLLKEIVLFIKATLKKSNDEVVHRFISQSLNELANNIELEKLLASGIEQLVESGNHQKLIAFSADKIKEYVLENDSIIHEAIQKESSPLVPKIVNRIIAEKISNALVAFLGDVVEDKEHPLRNELTEKINEFVVELKETELWSDKINELRSLVLNEEKANSYAVAIWSKLKAFILEKAEDDLVLNQAQKIVSSLADDLKTNYELQEKIDNWVRFNVYKIALRNADKVSLLISSTVEEWEAEDLSRKLELEVGKDLQFIRVNGTIVGGLVGLIIHAIVQFFS